MKGNVFKLHADKVGVWREWAEYLLKHRDEVEQTLGEENILFEGSFIFTHNGDTFVCLYAKSGEQEILPANLDREINRLHREKMKECFAERLGPIENLYFFSALT